MATGKIVYWNTDRGFGFVAPAEGGDAIFAHFSQWKEGDSDELPKGTRVSFDRVASAKYPEKFEAKDIHVINEGNPQ